MSANAAAEIGDTKTRNSVLSVVLYLCAVGWVIGGLAAAGSYMMWLSWAVAVICAAGASLPEGKVLTPADTAKRWLRRRLDIDVSTDEAAKYGPLFSGYGDPAGVLAKVIAEPDRDAAIFMLRAAANEWSQAQNVPPPFIDEARAVLRARQRAESEHDAREQAARRTDDQRRAHEQASAGQRWSNYRQYTYTTGSKQSAPPPPPTPSVDRTVNVALVALGLTSMPATHSELKRAWKSRLSDYHPDRYAQEQEQVRKMAHEMALQVNRAYEELCRIQGWQA